MTAQLVLASFNGKPTHCVEFFPAPRSEIPLGVVHRRIPLTEAESNLPLDQLRTLFDVKALTAQRGAGT